MMLNGISRERKRRCNKKTTIHTHTHTHIVSTLHISIAKRSKIYVSCLLLCEMLIVRARQCFQIRRIFNCPVVELVVVVVGHGLLVCVTIFLSFFLTPPPSLSPSQLIESEKYRLND